MSVSHRSGLRYAILRIEDDFGQTNWFSVVSGSLLGESDGDSVLRNNEFVEAYADRRNLHGIG